MITNRNRRPGANWHGGEQTRKGLKKSNIVSLAPSRNGSPFDELTIIVALDRLKRGTFPPALLVELLNSVGVHR